MTIRWALQSVIVATLGAAPVSANAADWRITPLANSGITYIDNPRLTPHSDEQYANYHADLSAPMSFDDGRSSVSLTPRLLLANYPEDSLLDRNDKYIALTALRRFETASWSLSANYVRDTTLTSELGLTGLQEVDRPHESVSVITAPTLQLSDRMQLGAQLYWSDDSYRNALFTGLVDYRYSLAAASATYVLGPAFTLSTQGSFGRLEVPATGERSDTINVTAALGWQYSELWSAQLSFGPSRVASAGINAQGYVYSAGVKHQGLRSTLSADIGRDVTPTGRGVLVMRDQATLSTQYSLTQKLTWTIAAQFVRTQDAIGAFGAGPQTVDYGSVDVGLRWQVRPSWIVLLSVNGRTQDYDLQADRASGSSVVIGLLWQGDAHAWSR